MTAFITCPGKLETDEACRSAAPGVHLPVGVASENEPVVLLLRHAVGTPEVAAVRHREPEIGQWPVSNIGHADGGPLGWQRVQLGGRHHARAPITVSSRCAQLPV